jgi:D-sedoheptulose 7-phosphate isomerase
MTRAQGDAGDIIIGLSTSGNSPNVLKAFEAAKELKMNVIAFTGTSGGKMREYADVLLNVPSGDTPRIQESHILLGHLLCELIESQMFPNPNKQ